MSPQEAFLDFESAFGAGKYLTLANINYLNARFDFYYAKKDKNAIIFKDCYSITDKNFQKALDAAQIPKRTWGVKYNSYSEYSNQLAKSKELINFVNKNYTKLKNGYYKNTTVNIDFTPSNRIPSLNSLADFFGIRHATLYNPHIGADNRFKAILFDYYDFKQRKYNSFADIINNHGYSMQEKGLLENYVIIYEINSYDYL